MVERYRPRTKYQRWYDDIIERARGRTLLERGECHHVIPRCLGGSNKKSNLVKLTYREHFLAHWLLTKIVPWPGKRKMLYALAIMVPSHLKAARPCASWQFEVARKAAAEAASGVTPKPKTRAKLSRALKRWYKNNPVPPEECQARSLRMIGNDHGKYGSGNTGHKHSSEECERRRIRMLNNQFAKGKKYPRDEAYMENLIRVISTPEYKRSQKAGVRRALSRPDVKARTIEAQRRRRARERAEHIALRA